MKNWPRRHLLVSQSTQQVNETFGISASERIPQSSHGCLKPKETSPRPLRWRKRNEGIPQSSDGCLTPRESLSITLEEEERLLTPSSELSIHAVGDVEPYFVPFPPPPSMPEESNPEPEDKCARPKLYTNTSRQEYRQRMSPSCEEWELNAP